MHQCGLRILAVAVLLSVCFASTALAGQPTRGEGWPPAHILKEFGLEGMPQPAGADNVWWRNAESEEARGLPGGDIPHILIGLHGTEATGGSLKSWFEGNGWILMGSRNNAHSFNKGAAVVSFDFSDGVGQVKAGVHKGTWPGNAVWERFGLSSLTMPPGVAISDVQDSGNEVNIFTIGGNNADYVNLRNQFIAKMGQPTESEGKDGDDERRDAFWNPKTSVAVYLGREGVEIDFSMMKH